MTHREAETVCIEQRYCGPPDSGNGGYSAGLLGARLPGVTEVRLHRPPPLEKPLRLVLHEDTGELRDDDTVIAEARRGHLEGSPPAAPSLETARASSRHYLGFSEHSFPTCFVCGPARSRQDGGLCIYPGPVAGSDLVAAPWEPATGLADEDGNVAPLYLWAALDCPSGFAAMGRDPDPMVLGTLTVSITGALQPGDPCVVIGWPLGSEGRKHYAASAICRQDGEPVAQARAIWIAI